jgi:hypothetical protein
MTITLNKELSDTPRAKAVEENGRIEVLDDNVLDLVAGGYAGAFISYVLDKCGG